jgi:hypothetical protein
MEFNHLLNHSKILCEFLTSQLLYQLATNGTPSVTNLHDMVIENPESLIQFNNQNAPEFKNLTSVITDEHI